MIVLQLVIALSGLTCLPWVINCLWKGNPERSWVLLAPTLFCLPLCFLMSNRGDHHEWAWSLLALGLSVVLSLSLSIVGPVALSRTQPTAR